MSGIEETVARVRKWMGFTRRFVSGGNPVISLAEWQDIDTLLAAVDTRTRERDEAVELLDLAQQEAPRVLADALAPIEAERDALRQRFRDYGEHTETCDSWSGFSTDPSGCSCGFTASWYTTFPEDKP